MGWFGTMLQAGIAAYTAARRVFEDPTTAHNQTLYLNQQAMYNLLWSYYNGSMFERIVGAANAWNWNIYAGGWQAYKSNYNLYRNIRLIYNPTRRLVDFYAGQVYPGVLSVDGKKLPDGISLAVPFSEDTPQELRAAIAQFWQSSNWQARKAVQVRYGAALGNVLIEVVDDVEHGCVSADIIWPGFVVDLETDNAGNVKRYVLQYQAQDETGGYLYRKEVDKDAFRYFRDEEPYNYGAGQVVPNPYGFVPAVWIKHIDVGGRFGSPAMSGSFGKIDELNNLASQVHDHIHKAVGAPSVFWTDGRLSKLDETPKRPFTIEESEPSSDQESIQYIKGPKDGRVESLVGNLSLADAGSRMDKLYEELEQDHPELTFYKELRAMSQVTGPAASRLVGDVNSRFAEAAASYDQANIRLFQMAVAIGGFRANSGAWGKLNRQQQKYLPFDLASFERGELDMEIMPRPLLVPTRMEIGQENEQMWRGVMFAQRAGVPPEFVLRDAGWSDDKIAMLAQVQQSQQIAPTQPVTQAPPQNTPAPASGTGQH
jgi:hypothetical protein